MNLSRLALAVSVAGLVLAALAVLAQDRRVTWVAIGFVALAIVLRWMARRGGGATGSGPR